MPKLQGDKMNLTKEEHKKTLDRLNEIIELLEQPMPDIKNAKKVTRDLELLFYDIERRDLKTWHNYIEKKKSKLEKGLKK